MISYPNQKLVCINRDIPKQAKENKRPYLIAYRDVIADAAKTIHKPTSFKLYMYLISNQDKFTIALSTKDFSEEYGVSIDSAKDAVNDLIALGYLVCTKKNQYEFYEKPQEEQEELVPVEEIRKSFRRKNGDIEEFTLSELIEKMGKERAEEVWRSAQ